MAQGSGDQDYTDWRHVQGADAGCLRRTSRRPDRRRRAPRNRGRRARQELGLRCLVIDYDDLMKRIRDYPKGKPTQGRLRRRRQAVLSAGRQHADRRCTFDDIDKDEMVVQWKQQFREFNLTAPGRLELTGMESAPDNSGR